MTSSQTRGRSTRIEAVRFKGLPSGAQLSAAVFERYFVRLEATMAWHLRLAPSLSFATEALSRGFHSSTLSFVRYGLAEQCGQVGARFL